MIFFFKIDDKFEAEENNYIIVNYNFSTVSTDRQCFSSGRDKEDNNSCCKSGTMRLTFLSENIKQVKIIIKLFLVYLG